MECTGKIKSIGMDIVSGKYILTLEINEKIAEALEKLLKVDKLSFVIKKFRKHRSLDANAYFHVLVTEMADINHTSILEMKNDLIKSYGQYFYQDDEIPMLSCKSSLWDNQGGKKGIYIHLLEQGMHPAVVFSDDPDIVKFRLMRGSHTYNTKEMATLIDGTVQEAKDLGIDTYTEQQLKEMKERWGI